MTPNTDHMSPEEKKMFEESQKRFNEIKTEVLAISTTPGYKQLMEFWRREEQNIDNQLPMVTGLNLEVAVKVRASIKRFLQMQENLLKENE